ncbi:MAG: TldD/PmbA family protein [Candidatus Rokubacteria bacterium]|nr:TldD/PmbA family protein [Candidatus Rokubacteria bacterium]
MPVRLETALIDRLTPLAEDVVAGYARGLPHLAHADLRLEIVEGRFATAENGKPRAAGEEESLALGIRVLAGEAMIAPGYVGRSLGAADLARLEAILKEGVRTAHRRALVNAERKAEAREKLGPLGESLADTRLHPVPIHRATVPATYRIDPRAVGLGEMTAFSREVGGAVAALDPRVAYSYVSTSTQLGRELFASTEGALIDQSFALTQGLCHVVTSAGTTSQELYDVLGHQRGWEILLEGVDDPLLAFPPFPDFCRALTRDALDLAVAPALPALDGAVTVVTDPHYNTLVSHEIVGHPVELDRALKMETAYAGRSWLLRDLRRHEIGRQIASPLVTAYSDPALPGYGHYAFDHEGTPARRVVHIEHGLFTGFMNSRQTAAVLGAVPNGHWKTTDASLVPLIRMSSTVFAGGDRDPADILGEVDHGYYLVGHRIPSIAESRENFRISARKVYEIRHGRLGQLYRDGGMMADSRDYLMRVDAVGSDFRLYPISNCGKGQPMQSRKLGNGGPTMRSRARLTGGMSP